MYTEAKALLEEKDDQLSFMSIKLKVADKTVSGDLSKDLRIPEDVEELVKEIERYPSMLFYWSSVAEVAKSERDMLEQRYDRWHSEIYLKCKTELHETQGASKVTETQIKAYMQVKYGDEMSAKKEEIVKAEYRRAMLLLVAKAMQEKGSAMINVLSWRKQQLKDTH
jgi:hypothetical protein